ncbi:hypothetical protein L484_016934 [Morus notabilis]|uniref:Uncharacterized protein n=1 Tax=Morus notabilis TaxID=981085 RepID=W9SK48_9ROSA|nr:hypothetical protein L484_016934 [Morus notabilis]
MAGGGLKGHFRERDGGITEDYYYFYLGGNNAGSTGKRVRQREDDTWQIISADSDKLGDISAFKERKRWLRRDPALSCDWLLS